MHVNAMALSRTSIGFGWLPVLIVIRERMGELVDGYGGTLRGRHG